LIHPAAERKRGRFGGLLSLKVWHDQPSPSRGRKVAR